MNSITFELLFGEKGKIICVFIDHIPHSSPLPPKYTCFESHEEARLNEAIYYFNKALFELNLTVDTFPTITITHSDLSFEKPLVIELQKQWKEILGIPIATQQLAWNDFSAALEKGTFQLGGLYRRDLFNNPLFYLSFFKSSPLNPYRIDNQEYMNRLEQFAGGENTLENLKRLEAILLDETPVISLVNQRCLALISPHLTGVKWDSNGCLNFTTVYKEVII